MRHTHSEQRKHCETFLCEGPQSCDQWTDVKAAVTGPAVFLFKGGQHSACKGVESLRIKAHTQCLNVYFKWSEQTCYCCNQKPTEGISNN